MQHDMQVRRHVEVYQPSELPCISEDVAQCSATLTRYSRNLTYKIDHDGVLTS
jgi:hypothetical protein